MVKRVLIGFERIENESKEDSLSSIDENMIIPILLPRSKFSKQAHQKTQSN